MRKPAVGAAGFSNTPTAGLPGPPINKYQNVTSVFNATKFVPQAETAVPADLDISTLIVPPKRNRPNRVRVSRPDLVIYDEDDNRSLRFRNRMTRMVDECSHVIAHSRAIEQPFDAQVVLRIVKPLLTLKWTTLGRDPAPRIMKWAQEHLPESIPHDDPDSIVMHFNRDDLAEALQISQDTKLACVCRYLVSVDDTMEARKARKRPKDRIGAQQRRVRNGGKRQEDCTTRDDERTLAVVLGLGCWGDRTIRNWKKKGVPVSALRRWHSDGTYEGNVDMVRRFGLVVPEFSQKRRSRPIMKGLVATSLGKKPTSANRTAGVAGQDGSRAGIADADTSIAQTPTRENGRNLEAVTILAGPSAAPQTWPVWVRMEVLALAA